MTLVTGFELLENRDYAHTHSILDRFKIFQINPYELEDLKYLLFCLDSGRVLYW